MIMFETNRLMSMCNRVAMELLHKMLIDHKLISLTPVRKKQPSYPINNRRGFAARDKRKSAKRRNKR